MRIWRPGTSQQINVDLGYGGDIQNFAGVSRAKKIKHT